MAVRRFLAAMIIALGLSFAQPAISSGQLFRVGQAEIVELDDHRRVDSSSDEPPVPTPDERATWYLVLWTAADFDEAIKNPGAVTALARGDPGALGLSERAMA